MMLMNKSRVVINIEPQILYYKILTAVKQPFIINNNEMICCPYQNINEVEMFITDLQKNIPRNTVFELNFDETYIQTQQLTLPDIKLKSTEIELLVEASIYKIFQLSVKNVFFDFIYQLNQPQQIMVIICERHYVDIWINLFKKFDLSLGFIGCVIGDIQVNFLPWRQTKRKKNQQQLAIVITCFIGIMSCMLCYLWLQAQAKLEYYSAQVIDKQEIQEKLVRELSDYLPNASPSQKQIQQSLLLISNQLPPVIWLESFAYAPHTINLQGHSLNYVDIINFNENLLKQKNISKSYVQSISSNKNNLLFEMDIKLSEQ